MDISDLYRLVAQLEADSSLSKLSRLRSRIRFLDQMDAYSGDGLTEAYLADEGPVYERARTLQSRIEALNSGVYRSIRNKIRRGAEPGRLRRWIQKSGYTAETRVPGLGYDDLDELVSGVLDLREPAKADNHGAEMVFYQPTPVRHILDLIAVSALSEGDVLVDLGSGLGHVSILSSILTGCRSIGIELETAYIESARDCAEKLALNRVEFVQQDARDTDVAAGNVFYLYTPFTGTIFSAVMARLRREAEKREIRVCTLGPCSSVVARESWLKASGAPNEDRITCFSSEMGSYRAE
jgi:hypothetical protein